MTIDAIVMLREDHKEIRRAFLESSQRPRRVVLLCDISGSMEPYARALLRFVHAAVAGRGRVEAFTLGTRLTRLTRELSSRDPDAAQQVTSRLSHLNAELERIERVGQRVEDLEVLVELGLSENDADTLVEAEAELEALKKTVSELEVRTLLNGELDEREALVTVRAEAGCFLTVS